MQVRIGFSKRPENDTFADYYVKRRASKIIYHKRFHAQNKMDNNIALVVLDEPVMFDEHVSPITIFNGATGYDSGHCVASEAGWIKPGNKKVTGIFGGKIHFIEAPMTDFSLKESLTRVTTYYECRKELASEVTQKMICAKPDSYEMEGLTGHFKGNDGGPLVIKVGDMVQQVGIKSWAYQGGLYPTVYTRIDSYFDWILDNITL